MKTHDLYFHSPPPFNSLFQELKHEVTQCLELQNMANRIIEGQLDPSSYSLRGGVILFKQKYYISPESPLIRKILTEFHDSPIGGHFGIYRTLRRIATHFWWSGMAKPIRDYVQDCVTCQKMNHKIVGLLMPLPIPTTIWSHILKNSLITLLNFMEFLNP